MGYNKGQVLNSNNYGAIHAEGMTMSMKNAGGLVGYSEGYIKGCYNGGAVTTSNGIYNYAGGIVGVNAYNNVENCYNDGNVLIEGGSWCNFIGGVAGSIGFCDIKNCVNTGIISNSCNTVPCYIGGLCGSENGNGNIINSYNTGDIHSVNSGYTLMGGITGNCSSNMQNCYNSGNLIYAGGTNYPGGLAGDNNGTAQNCYWLSTATINNATNAFGRGTMTGVNIANNATFDMDGALSKTTYLGVANTGVSSEYLLNSLNAWASANTSNNNTPYKTWMSIATFNNGFPIYGTPNETAFIINNPTNQNVYVGQKATFTVSVAVPTDAGTLSYQWQGSTNNGMVWNKIEGATAASYTTDNLAIDDNSKKYRCIVKNTRYGMTTKINSTAATLFVTIDPTTELNGNDFTGIQTFPNPINKCLKINGINGNATLKLYDAKGSLVLIKSLEKNNTISVDFLSKGIYNLRITTKDGIIEKKILKD